MYGVIRIFNAAVVSSPKSLQANMHFGNQHTQATIDTHSNPASPKLNVPRRPEQVLEFRGKDMSVWFFLGCSQWSGALLLVKKKSGNSIKASATKLCLLIATTRTLGVQIKSNSGMHITRFCLELLHDDASRYLAQVQALQELRRPPRKT